MLEPTFGDLVRDMAAPFLTEQEDEAGRVAHDAFYLVVLGREIAPGEDWDWGGLDEANRAPWVAAAKAVLGNAASKPRAVVTAVEDNSVPDLYEENPEVWCDRPEVDDSREDSDD